MRRENRIDVVERQMRHLKTFQLNSISLSINCNDNAQQRARRTDAFDVLQRNRITSHNSLKQAAPREVDVHLRSDPVQLRRKFFDGRLREQCVGRSTFGWFPINFFGDFLKWTAIRVDSKKELSRLGTRVVVDKQAVARADINYSARAEGSKNLLERRSINLSSGFTAN